LIKLNVKDVEKALGKKLDKKVISIGVDTASRAGICSAYVDKDTLHLDTQFIDIASTDLYFKYNALIKSFKSMLTVQNPENYRLVIEDTFFGKNVNVLKMISRMGMIVYMCGHEAGIQDITFIYPTTSRKNLGIKGNLKKVDVHKELARMLGIKLDDPDISDAIILSICGLLRDATLLD
jgi:Holliday junction resolvasome RuvABC endonuclease subunit